jgi:RHS repeat-associated protein
MIQGFLWLDELHPAAELGATGGIVAKFIYADKANVPSVMYKNGYEYRIISDHLGSVRMVVDNNSGAILQQLDYDPYGRVIVDTNPGFQPFGYAGGLYDRDTGLVRFGRRDYNPAVGRWTSKDPIGFAGGLNLYGYVVQDPVNLVDATGQTPITNNSGRPILYKPEHESRTMKIIEDGKTEDVDGIYSPEKKTCIKIPGNCRENVNIRDGSIRTSCNWYRFLPLDPERPLEGWFPGRPKEVGPEFFEAHSDWPNPYTGRNGSEGL